MIKITLEQLQKMGACESGIEWFTGQRARTLKRIVPKLIKSEHANYAFWLLSRLMTHPQKVNFAICAVEQVLELFEKEYPADDRPRKAIQAAKDFLAGKITADAADAAANAADAAANAAANAAYAAYAAANAADAAANAAYAAYAAANAAYAAANAAYAAYAANAADAAANAANAAANAAAHAANAAAHAANAAGRRATETKIADYGLTLLGEGGKRNGK
jgi:hypothetical protein